MNSKMKKDFQKIVKAFRDALPDEHFIHYMTKQECTCRPELPKAMMTQQQERNRTATANFGKTANAAANAERFLASDTFASWCTEYGINRAYIEINSDKCYQVRVNY